MTSFYEDWNWLQDEAGNRDTSIENCISIEVVKVDPVSMRINDQQQYNTLTQVWLEFGWPEYDENAKGIVSCHNLDWDTGGDTFEQAFCRMVELIKSNPSPTNQEVA